MRNVWKAMLNGLSSFTSKPDVKTLSTYEMAAHFGKAMSGNAPAHFSLQSEEEGDFHLNTLSLTGLTRRFTLNEFKLKYGFKKLFGSSVMQYVYEKRLNYSKKLLLETDKTIIEIADILGFHHSNNFCASFKKKFGNSPTKFRTNP